MPKPTLDLVKSNRQLLLTKTIDHSTPPKVMKIPTLELRKGPSVPFAKSRYTA
jgi:hypothetical protein